MRKWVLALSIFTVSLGGFAPRSCFATDSALKQEYEQLVSAAIQGIAQKWPDDYRNYASRFWAIRQACNEAARVQALPKPGSRRVAGLAVTTVGADLSLRQERALLPKLIPNEIENLRHYLAYEYDQNVCTAIVPIAVVQMGEYSAFKVLLDTLEADVKAGKFASCRRDIDGVIGKVQSSAFKPGSSTPGGR